MSDVEKLIETEPVQAFLRDMSRVAPKHEFTVSSGLVVMFQTLLDDAVIHLDDEGGE